MTKVIPPEQLGSLVKSGDTVGLGGAWLSNHPMAAVRQIIRNGIGDLHVIGSLSSIDVDLLINAGLVRELTFSMVSLEAYGMAPHFRTAVQDGRVTIHEVTGVAMTVGLEAGARRLPFLPMRGVGESELPGRSPANYSSVQCPFTDETFLAIRAFRPDVAIVHARRADEDGNAQVDGPLGNDPELARAADRVVVTCERVVDRDEIASNPAATHVPGFLVEAVVHAPFGAHPTTHVPEYGLDAWAIKAYADACAAGGAEAYREQLRTETEDEYRERVLDDERRAVLRAVAGNARALPEVPA